MDSVTNQSRLHLSERTLYVNFLLCSTAEEATRYVDMNPLPNYTHTPPSPPPTLLAISSIQCVPKCSHRRNTQFATDVPQLAKLHHNTPLNVEPRSSSIPVLDLASGIKHVRPHICSKHNSRRHSTGTRALPKRWPSRVCRWQKMTMTGEMQGW